MQTTARLNHAAPRDLLYRERAEEPIRKTGLSKTRVHPTVFDSTMTCYCPPTAGRLVVQARRLFSAEGRIELFSDSR